MSILNQVADRAARLVLRSGPVRSIEDIGPAFRRIAVDLDADAPWTPGCKVQFRVAGVTFRTFTPFGWGAGGGAVSFLVHRHGPGPATGWVDALEVGAVVQLFGPRRSLSLVDLDGGPVLVGDETSFALAAAWTAHGSARPVAQVYEVTGVADAEAVLAHLGVGPATLVARTDGDGHHPDLARRVIEALAADPAAPLALTGKAQTIRAVRGALKDAGLAPTVRVKAYWDPDRSGLD